MALREQRYSPDTCGCVFIETWDPDVDPSERVHVVKTREVACPVHAGDAPATAYGRMYEENRRKNVALNILRTLESNMAQAKRIAWSFDASRNLVVSGLASYGVTAQRLQQLQAAADLQFGVGKVTLSL